MAAPDVVVNDEDLMGEEEPFEEMGESNPDKPMYPPLQISATQVIIILIIYVIILILMEALFINAIFKKKAVEEQAVRVPAHRLSPLRRDWPKVSFY